MSEGAWLASSYSSWSAPQLTAMPGVCHWGPLVAITIISIVTVTSTYTALQLWSLPHVRAFRLESFVVMYVWLFLIIKNFCQALGGPGFVPLKWKPAVKADEESLQFCHVCDGFKPPRTHHCRQCKRCVMKMDHHCPWINSCVGHVNHASFTRFLIYVPVGCLHGVIINSNYLYRLLTYEYVSYKPYFPITTFWVFFPVAGIGLGIGTVIGVCILLVVQLRAICRNRTQIEDWILNKAQHRREEDEAPFVYPYDLGCRRNCAEVLNLSGRARGDGLEWTLREGSGRFDLTLEQIEQKKLKRRQAITCRIKQDFSGSCCPLTFGLLTCLCSPHFSEGKIPVTVGTVYTVTRWHKHWVYGDRTLMQGEVAMGERQKGWFPRQCVSKEEVELRSHTPSDDVDVNEHKPLAATATTNQKAAAASKPEEGPRKRAKGKDEKKKRSRKTGKGKSGGGAEHAAKEE